MHITRRPCIQARVMHCSAAGPNNSAGRHVRAQPPFCVCVSISPKGKNRAPRKRAHRRNDAQCVKPVCAESRSTLSMFACTSFAQVLANASIFQSSRKGGNVAFPKRAVTSSDTQCTSRGGLAYKYAQCIAVQQARVTVQVGMCAHNLRVLSASQPFCYLKINETKQFEAEVSNY